MSDDRTFSPGAFVSSQFTRLIETDGQTYGFTITNTALHIMQRGKKDRDHYHDL